MLRRFFRESAFVLFALISILSISKPQQIFAQTIDEDEEESVVDESSLYTLMPMFLGSVPSELNYSDLLSSMVEDQGYEAHCGGATWVIESKVWGNIEKFFSQSTPPLESFYKGASGIFSGSSSYIVDFTTGRIPVLRGLEKKTSTLKNSSIEGMFGANYQTIEKNYMLNASGVTQNLLTSYQQCLAKTQNLVGISKICAEIDGECVVNKKYKMQVDSTNITFKALEILEWFSAIRPSLGGKELYEQVCADITGGGSYDPSEYNAQHDNAPNASDELLAQTNKAIETIPINLDSLYRLAFLVLVPEQQPKDNDNFYFLQSSPQLNEKVHAPIFIAFKIPEFGTNKSAYVNNIDSLELTKMALQTADRNAQDISDQNAMRSSIYETAKNAPYLEDPLVKCPDSFPQCQRTKPNTLLNVVLDIINGAAPDCNNVTLRIVEDTTVDDIFNQEDQSWEKAGDLFTPSNKDIKENLYKYDANQEAADRLTAKDTNLFDWQAIVDQEETNFGDSVIVRAYLVLPVGETIKDTNKSLAIFWDEDQFFDMVKTNIIEDMKNADGTSKQGAIPKYYTIKGANVGIDASDIRSYTDSCEPAPVLVEDENGNFVSENICTNYKFGIKLEETKDTIPDKYAPLFPDFGLGYMLRKIQLTIRATYDSTYDYIASCQRVEDMFLGRCSGDPTGKATSLCEGVAYANLQNMPSADGVPEFAKDIFSSEIASNITDEMIEAYEYAEQETGIPCEVAAGVHWVEGGSNANQSLFDGGALHGTLKEDAKAAMEHLIDKWPSAFDRNNMEYQDLVAAMAAYNGYGNLNCTPGTRWFNGGKCPAEFDFEDHPHALGYVDDRHSDMDLIYCLDFVEFNCSASPTSASLASLRSELDQKQTDYDFSDERKEGLINDAATYCYANSGVCQSLSSGGKYPRFERPGSITTAILLNAAGQ